MFKLYLNLLAHAIEQKQLPSRGGLAIGLSQFMQFRIVIAVLRPRDLHSGEQKLFFLLAIKLQHLSPLQILNRGNPLRFSNGLQV